MGIRIAERNVPVLDELRVSEVGRLRREGLLSHPEYEAGVNYGKVMLLYLASIDAPEPYGGDIGPLSQSRCFGRKMTVAAAKTILRDISPRCMRVVDRITVYDCAIAGDEELALLQAGLYALTGVNLHLDSFDEPADRASVWDYTVIKADRLLAQREAFDRARAHEDRHRK